MDEWARRAQALTRELRLESISHAARLTTVEAGLVTLNAEVDALALAAPSLHATTHASGGTDPIKLDDLATPDDNTDLNASTTRHGLLRKLDGLTTTFLRGDGTWAAPASGVAIGDTFTSATAGRIPYVGAGPVWADSSGLTFSASSGRLAVGFSAANALGRLHAASDTGDAHTILDTYNASAAGGYFIGRHARGTAASPSATQSGDVLAFLAGRGYGSGAWETGNAGGFLVFSAEARSSTAMGTFLAFNVTQTGTTSPSRRMMLDDRGNLLLGGATSPASATSSMVIQNGTVPTGSVTDSVILHAADLAGSSRFYVRNEAGVDTLLSPHAFSGIPDGPSEEMAWVHHSEFPNGRHISVDMLAVVREVERLSGRTLVHTGNTADLDKGDNRRDEGRGKPSDDATV